MNDFPPPLRFAKGVNAHLTAHSCFDKAHRCPASAGPGWKAPETIRGVSECQSGSVRVPAPGAETVSVYDDYPGDRPWTSGRCIECGVRTYQYAWRKFVPAYWLHNRAFLLRSAVRQSWRRVESKFYRLTRRFRRR